MNLKIGNCLWQIHARIKFVFEEPVKVGRPPLNPRIVFKAPIWILESGARWRDLPARYGNWNSIYHKFRQWCESGLFELLFHLVNADAVHSILLEIDSTFCKVHQSACCALNNQAIGVSSGGKNTKVHVLINDRMQLLNVILTGGNIHDSQPAIELFDNVADKAYSCQAIRAYLEQRRAVVCIPDKSTFKTKHTFNAELYKQRNIVEQFFQRIKNYRHISTSFDKLAVCFLNFILLAASVIHF